MDFGIFAVLRQKLFLSHRTATLYDRLLAAPCRLFVRPSVCNAVYCGSQGRGLKLYQRVPSRQVLICPFRKFCKTSVVNTFLYCSFRSH